MRADILIPLGRENKKNKIAKHKKITNLMIEKHEVRPVFSRLTRIKL